MVTAKIEHLFYKRAGVPKAARLGSRSHFFSDQSVSQMGKKNWKIKQDSGGVDKDISVLLVMNVNREIRKVNNQC